MRVLILLLSLGLSSCEFQDDPLVTSIQAQSVSQADFERSFERYLELFVVDNPNETEFDTLVDYKTMYELSINPSSPEGAEYQELVSTIGDYFISLQYDDLNIESKKAHLINAYNFFVMDYMARNYPTVTNILNAPVNVFTEEPFLFAGQRVSLDYLEKALLYGLMTFETSSETNIVNNLGESVRVPKGNKVDARFHFAVICGALGCPILNTEMYYADRLDDQLTDITRKGLKLKRNLDQSNGNLRLTELFNWYESDFNNHAENASSTEVADFYEFLELYTDEPVLRVPRQTIPYNWERNGLN